MDPIQSVHFFYTTNEKNLNYHVVIKLPKLIKINKTYNINNKYNLRTSAS